jgi:mitochondrial chaperone BCS1
MHFSNNSSHEAALPNHLLVETLLPGFTAVFRLLTRFGIDISSNSTIFLLLTGVVWYYASYLRDMVIDYFTSTILIRKDDEVYEYITAWISKHHLSQDNHRIIASTKVKIYDDDETDGDDDLDSRKKLLKWTPSFGIHFFRYKNRILSFARFRDDTMQGRVEEISISCLGRNEQILKQLVKEAQRDRKRQEKDSDIPRWSL